MTQTEFLDYRVNNESCKIITDKTMAWLDDKKTSKIVNTINPHSAVVASEDKAFTKALKKSDILLPDGIGVVLACRLKKLKMSERISGYDFFEAFSRKANAKGKVSYFFLGSSEAVLEKIRNRMEKDYPNIEVVGTYSPPFKPEFSDEDNQHMCDAVNKAKADVLWVGMTAPKQEKWIAQNHEKLDVHFSAAIGAVFDFYAETKSRAPEWI